MYSVCCSVGIPFAVVLLTGILWCLYSKYNEGSETQEDALETQNSHGIGLSDIPPDTEQHGNGEDNIENDSNFESVHVQDGTLQIASLNHNLNTVGIQLSKNGYLSAPDVNRDSNQAMNRIMRDDPGGVNDTRGQHTVWSSEKFGSQDYMNEGQHLLSNQRTSVQDFDNVGEAVGLVNKRGFDQFSRCSTLPDTDAESMTPSMKNHNIYK
ncbi:hypothetical protein PAMP_008979 [Pampus punctatissimus]